MEKNVDVDSSTESQFMMRFMDLKFVLTLLFLIFGILVTISGFIATPEDIEKAAGINISLWTGISLLVLSAAFGVWWQLSPPEIPTSSLDRKDLDQGSEDENFQMP